MMSGRQCFVIGEVPIMDSATGGFLRPVACEATP